MVKIASSFVVILFTLLTATISGQDTDVSPNVLHSIALRCDTMLNNKFYPIFTLTLRSVYQLS